eukprot:TRINITY_DN14261_c0_g1_i1.p1 TRINITY_DN14261_c0_g1~~TRINITY_DN14261_c0_g1_i1.p1  ORF type:complete len:227 (-),score=34.04 TRINITY_DN14261_c0_g1_i1:46-726(-)
MAVDSDQDPRILRQHVALFQSQAENTTEKKMDLYNLSNYTFSMKDQQEEKDQTSTAFLQRLRDRFELEGTRKTVEAILLVHQHNHPHVLLLQLGNNHFKLPGGRCRAGEDELSCLRRKLSKKLSPPNQYSQPAWEIGEVLGCYWRPNFEQHMYPYLPPHITKPKECCKLFIVHLPEKCIFAVPRNYKLLAVPLFEFHENSKRYGSVIASIPQILSRFHMNCMMHGI